MQLGLTSKEKHVSKLKLSHASQLQVSKNNAFPAGKVKLFFPYVLQSWVGLNRCCFKKWAHVLKRLRTTAWDHIIRSWSSSQGVKHRLFIWLAWQLDSPSATISCSQLSNDKVTHRSCSAETAVLGQSNDQAGHPHRRPQLRLRCHCWKGKLRDNWALL